MHIRLLAINTTNIFCSVALSINNVIISEYLSKAPYKQPHLAIPIIDSALLEVGLSLTDIKYLSFSNNYGSYTGIRIGISLSQGLSIYTNLPLVNISTLEAVVQPWFSVKPKILLVIKANEEAYLTNYHKPNIGLITWFRRTNPNRLRLIFKKLSIELEQYKEYVIVSNIDLLFYLDDNLELRTITIKKPILLTAKSMLPIGIHKAIKGEKLSSEQVSPKYVFDIYRKEYCISYILTSKNKGP
ncbi:tRNA (adenosine(37)-N6)-threonylcarbamoyltransferase complex dimerization subunit type 1 TsaB [Candidatus Tremblaya phenacola]|uniref:tRNA (adenosine(37)-N6)-threonylcarbamoyltransferase complex dimerization subunit type 1 TsaB n=1 Tax=Candidatus Tremblayella phenacoccinincola TaxID=1010676 RepID=UPI00133062FB|nr:tRNA (adenosine(37)-N6)-threonylcarbamoyltransferase complex dimerization subunit type 1 TsaB [Candidatus Tremblaya phenacola]KAH0998237.1 TsaB protein, required for threonylcarbamoyladenosine formation in tRNA [Candidatus Tremblaya phenacola]